MKKNLTVFMAAVLVLGLLAGCGGTAGQPSGAPASDSPGTAGTQYISIATSSSGGAFSIIGTAMADILNRNIDGISANIEITGGSSENLLLADAGTCELAMSASDVLYLAVNGQGSFEGKQISNVQGVMGGHLTTTQVYVLKSSDIYSFDDLKGKKISVGPTGSVGNDAMQLIMESYGYKIGEDWTPEFLSHGDGAEALTDGNVDAVIIMSTVPCSPVQTAAASKDLRLLQIDQDKLQKILEEHPYYVPGTVPAGTYAGQDEEIRSFSSAAFLCCNKDLDDELVYQVVKNLCENTETLVNAYPQCDEWIAENGYRGMSGIIDMHPGAVRYFTEIGVQP